ncbi:hypothetical protein RHSIM_Rhsim04G0200400 [Rhododendron simsii]|uniref:Retroviral polymerase SH3-like domain-containing protein n=1 Tax=Rhododendron simsii TaxID=118357 RepID=A0A834GZW4_RHOSS|nr:hypothetical protein RHSIM_Rhsim04G0200400 [Rhododendron simsii]
MTSHIWVNKKMVKGLPHIQRPNELCESCILGKQHRNNFGKQVDWRASMPLELVHTDVCGPLKPISNCQNRYFLTFIDDYSRNTWVYFLKLKSKVFEKFKEFKALIDKESNYRIKTLCPTKTLKSRTPQEACTTHRPGVGHLRVFGCIAYAKIPEANRTKLEDKGMKCIFVVYGDRTMGYRLYNPVTQKVIFSRDVIFEENESWSWDQTEVTRNMELEEEEEQAS